MTLSDQLRAYNAWRRGRNAPQPDPKALGELLDTAAYRLEVLEREHDQFFENWHTERRKREALELVAEAVENVKASND